MTLPIVVVATKFKWTQAGGYDNDHHASDFDDLRHVAKAGSALYSVMCRGYVSVEMLDQVPVGPTCVQCIVKTWGRR